MDEQGGDWDQTPSLGRRSWTVVRLVQCITGPRLTRSYFLGRSNEVSYYDLVRVMIECHLSACRGKPIALTK